MARWVNIIDKKNPERASFLFDAGHFVSGPDPEHELQMKHMLRAMRVLDYDAVNLTATDFALGTGFLERAFKENKMPFVSTNLYHRDTGKPLVRTSRIIERNGVRIGVLGICRKDSETIVSSRDGDPIIEIREPIVSARDEVADLEGRCDVIVALTDMDFSKCVRLAEIVESIDFVIVSGVGREGYEKKKVRDGLVIKVRDKKRYLGNLKVEVEEGAPLNWVNEGAQKVSPSIPRDDEFEAMFYAYQVEAKEKGLEIAGLRLQDNKTPKMPKVDASGRPVDE